MTGLATSTDDAAVDMSSTRRASASNDRVVRALWIAVATVLGWSVFDDVPYVNLDRSWAHGLHLAHQQGLRFGDDIVFNYGPIGFIARPVAGTGPVFAVGVIATLLLTVAGASLVYRTLRSLPVPTAVVGPATAAVMLIAPFENLMVETLLVIAAVDLVRRRGAVDTFPVPVAAVAGFGAVMLALVKVSVGVPAIVVVVATTWVSRRAVIASIAAMTSTFLAIWVGTGQSLRDIVEWLRGTSQIASGHVSAMNLSDGSRTWEYLAVMGIAVAGAALVVDAESVQRLKGATRANSVVAVVVVVVIGWFTVRQGFTVHGARTRLVFFAAGWLLVGLVPWRRLSPLRRKGLVALVIVATACFVVAAGSLVRLINPVTPIGDAVESTRLVVSAGYRDARVEQARRDARANYGVPDSMLDRIDGSAVMVEPYEISASWAYGLEWIPIPSMQRYLGYTPYLDRLNADFLDSDQAPTFVLRQRYSVIQQRYAPAESPAFVTGLFCNYRVVDTSDRWDLLERSTNRCGAPTPIEVVRVEPGQVVEIPSSPEAATLVGVDFDRSWSNTISAALLKPLSNPHIGIDDQRFRMIPATSNTPALLRVDADWDAATGLVPGAETLVLDTPGVVTFSSMTVSPEA